MAYDPYRDCPHPWIEDDNRCRQCGIHAGNIIQYLRDELAKRIGERRMEH